MLHKVVLDVFGFEPIGDVSLGLRGFDLFLTLSLLTSEVNMREAIFLSPRRSLLLEILGTVRPYLLLLAHGMVLLLVDWCRSILSRAWRCWNLGKPLLKLLLATVSR